VSAAPGRIILLNGTGSAGKSSIARALQELSPTPLLHLGMDTFYVEVCPPKLLFRMVPPGADVGDGADAAESVLFLESSDTAAGREAGTSIVLPPFGRQLLSGLHHAVATLAALGNDVVVDHVLWYPPWLRECVALWQSFPVTFVGAHCPLATVEARELARGDRSAKGVVRWQHSRVHRHGDLTLPYDVEVDTSIATPRECAEQILERWQNGAAPTAFGALAAAFAETIVPA
jgi:chloramphenicol 3-O phosphotransferase